jgi:hypothetical protein
LGGDRVDLADEGYLAGALSEENFGGGQGKRTCVTSEPSILKSLSGWGWTLGTGQLEAKSLEGRLTNR